MHLDEPQTGSYEARAKNPNTGKVKRSVVAYWYVKGELHCLVNNQPVELPRAKAIWTWCGQRPLSEKVYRDVAERGLPWPGESAAVCELEQSSAPASASDDPSRPRYLSNMPPDDESLEGLTAQIEYLAEHAAKMIEAGVAKSQEAADEAAHLSEALRKLGIKADEKRKTEKKPHDDAAKEVQERWNPILAKARVYADLKATVIAPFLDAENRRRDAERMAAERAGRPAPETKPATAGSGAGSRKVHTQTVKDVKIVDYAKALMALKDHEFVTAAVQRAAEAVARAGVAKIDGCEITERTSAR
jgi:hypothetical protein